MTKTENPTRTAPCGCTFNGRGALIGMSNCSVMDAQTHTYRQMYRHSLDQRRQDAADGPSETAALLAPLTGGAFVITKCPGHASH